VSASTNEVTAMNLTSLLSQWGDGDRRVEERLVSEIYPVMRAQAQAQLGRLGGENLTWCATDLAHEAFERLVGQRQVSWRNREHFFAISSTVIRRVLVDYLRQRSAEKRGNGFVHLPLDELMGCQLPETPDIVDLLVLDDLLEQLGRSDQSLLRIVEMRIFSGLSTEQISQLTGLSVATVGRRWRFARAWLSEQIVQADHDGT